MGSKYLTDLATVMRRTGYPVYEVDGWKNRARGSGGYDSGRPNHVMVHHTASPPSADGWPDVNYCTFNDSDAPLCNLYIDRSGAWYVCAAGATNTNGSGHDPCGKTSDDSMNSSAIGIEAGNNGTGEQWPSKQLDSYEKGCRELCNAYGIPISCIHAHWEWAPTRKTDPAGGPKYQSGSPGPQDISWNMDEFRSACQGVAPTPEPTPKKKRAERAAHQEGDPMFIASKDGKYWIGNGIGRRQMADDAETDFVIEKFANAGTPLQNYAGGGKVTARSQVNGVGQMNRLGVDVAQ